MSEEEIFEILKAGSDGEAAAELFAARGISVPMYCVWKAKYRHLNLEELREVRRRELWRARGLLVVFLAATVSGAGGIVFALGRAMQTTITGAAQRPPADLPSSPTEPEPLGSGEGAHLPRRSGSESAPPEPNQGGVRRQATAPAAASKAPLAERGTRSDALLTTTEPGFRIQVAAAPSLQEGRVILERLASAGYPAYMSRAIVSNVEMFRVRVGPFDTLSAAAKMASQLQRDGYNGAWIAQ